MLVIRNDQMRVFDQLARARFVEVLTEHLVGLFPDQADDWGIDGMRKLADDAFDRAASYGITSEIGVGNFAELMVAFGPRFELAPDGEWAKSVLDNPRFDGAAKAMILKALARDLVAPEYADVFAAPDDDEEAGDVV